MGLDEAFTRLPSLTTSRLHLRPLQLEDATALFAIRSDREVTEGYGKEPHQSLEETHALIQRHQTFYEQRQGLLWGITFQGQETVIGTCMLFAFGPGFHVAETGYELHRASWGQGIMREAMTALLTYGFGSLALHRIEAVVIGSNLRSQQFLLKLGFTHEGTLRERVCIRNQFLDTHSYGLLTHEWPQSV